jgi:hypothetical protein
MTPEERLLKAIFGEKSSTKRTFKDEKKQKVYEYYCMTVPGYESIWNMMDAIPKEDIELYEADFNNVQSNLLKAYDRYGLLEIYAKRILRLKELNVPKVIEEYEYRMFFEKVIKLFDFKLTEEEIKEVHEPILQEESKEIVEKENK